MTIFIEILGWLGMVIVLAAFAAVSIVVDSKNILSATSWKYQLMNLVGSCFILLNNLLHGAWPGVALNVVWGLIAAVTLIALTRKK